MTWATSVPILVFLGLSVLDLGPMYATDRQMSDRQTSVRQQYGILSPYQRGFRKLYSRETQLLVTIQDLLFHQDKHVPVDMAILDFSKAFDVVPHRRLLGKLSLAYTA